MHFIRSVGYSAI